MLNLASKLRDGDARNAESTGLFVNVLKYRGSRKPMICKKSILKIIREQILMGENVVFYSCEFGDCNGK